MMASRFFRFGERSDARQVTADLGVTLAAVAGQEGEKAAGAGIVGRVENLPLAPPGAQQARAIELLDVERKVVAGTPTCTAISPAGSPLGPAVTSRRKTASRVS